MISIMNPMILGTAVGLLIGLPLFVSAKLAGSIIRLAGYVMLQITIALVTLMITTGSAEGGISLLNRLATSVQAAPGFPAGMIIGFVISGAAVAVLRRK